MTKQGWIIYRKQDADKNTTYIDWFIDECQEQNLELTLIYIEDIHIGIQNGKWDISLAGKKSIVPDFAVIRTIDPLLSKQLELMDVAVFNSSEIARLCNNKAYTYQAMAALGVSMVDSLFINKERIPVESPLQPPFVVKTVSGRGGNEVMMIHTDAEWKQFITEPQRDDLVIQSCDVELGKDLRVYVVGNQIVGAVLRESNDDFRANFALGGNVSWYELTDQEKVVVKPIIQQFDFGMVGIDFLFSREGRLLFNEIEDVVGSRMLSKVSNVNIIKEYVTFIHKKIEADNR